MCSRHVDAKIGSSNKSKRLHWVPRWNVHQHLRWRQPATSVQLTRFLTLSMLHPTSPVRRVPLPKFPCRGLALVQLVKTANTNRKVQPFARSVCWKVSVRAARQTRVTSIRKQCPRIARMPQHRATAVAILGMRIAQKRSGSLEVSSLTMIAMHVHLDFSVQK